MMSIPRELQVPIYPPNGAPVVTRINAALAFGGIELMTKTIKRVLGLPINHVFVVTFPKFRRAVDEMGCVYMTVDRRYYHRNEPGGEQYFEINLQPGYQRLCGPQALEFVANRHEDTSLNRDARDQRFLLEVKAQYGPRLFEDRESFERILGRTVETDVHGTGAVLDLLRLLVESAGKPVRQAHFQVNLGPTFDTATPAQIHEAVQSFLGGTAAISQHGIGGAVHAARRVHHHGTPGLGLTTTTAEELDHARSQAPSLPFPLEYPRARATLAAAGADELRRYAIRDPAGRVHPAYVVVVGQGQLGQFYDVQGTSWASPPLLANPGQEVHIGHRMYGIFYAGEQVRVVAWHEGGGVYWVENTLTNSLSTQQMLAIAQETTPVIGAPAAPATAQAVNVPAFRLPARTAATTGTEEEVGAVVGLAAMIAVVGLAAFVLVRQREVLALRTQVAAAVTFEAQQRPVLAAAGLLPPEPAAVAAPVGAGAVASPGAPTVSRPAPAGPPLPPPATGGPTATRSQVASARPTIYRARRRVRAGTLAAVVALVVAVAAGAYLLAGQGGGGHATGSPLRVSVFNASPTSGEARRIAAALRADHVAVGEVGSIGSTLGPGTFVLYPVGARSQASHVAALLASSRPRVTPLQPQVQSVIGNADQIVVVID
jgi:LCP family protein required for cell wall assembly